MDKFNENQKKVIETIDAPLLVIAGPGSGKTRTLVERVSYLINKKNIKAENILLATFTEKASKELITRISMNIGLGIDISDMYIGTIHSICLRIIDENIEYSYLKRNYKVLDDLEQKFFIYKNMKKFLNIEGSLEFFEFLEKVKYWDRAVELKKWIDRINEEGIDIAEKIGDKRLNYLKKVNNLYKDLLFQENVVDFSNIQFECYRILSENIEVLKEIRKKINYIMIDEYQDTNLIQEKIFLLITGEKNNICVVGDDDQGIYRFRGATVKNILNFEQKFEKGNFKKIELNINYRSNRDIVDFCNKWTDCLYWDGWRYKKELVSGKEIKNKTLGVVKISVKTSENDLKEKIYKFINKLKTTNKIQDYNQIAFLFKSVRNKKVLRLMEYLENKGIKVYSPRSNMFFSREEIKFCVGILLCVFYQSKPFLKNTYYRECFDKVVKEMETDLEFREYIKKMRNKTKSLNYDVENFFKILYSFIRFKSFRKYLDLKEDHILENRKTYNIGIFFNLVNKFDRICELERIKKEDIARVVNYFFGNHLIYLKNSGISEYEDIKEDAPKNSISFLTFHQSKGLEFPIVIVGSLESGPRFIMNEKQENLEFEIMEEFEPKERIKEFDFWRVYYTAFSRAQNLLALTCVEYPKIPIPNFAFQKVYNELSDISQEEFELSKLNLDSYEEKTIKESFSFTRHINLYNKCPRLYKLVNKYKFPELKTEELIYGELVHICLEEVNKMGKNNKKLSIQEVKDKYTKFYNDLQKRYNINLEDKLLKLGMENILDYYINYLDELGKIKGVEERIILSDEKYIIEGIVDLVIEKDGKLGIIDFKTGKLNEYTKEYEEQIQIYAYLLEKKYSKKISKGIIIYINECKDKKIIDVDLNEELILKTMDKFKRTANKIVNREYETGYLDKRACEYCNFRNYCKSYL
ncbi:CRISPR-associated protein Cas4 [Fusobacterium sp. MFO224]|uniref:CRISPR-associated protein Cas4 n=1 Tax=Fusobacterium sp. MFO224 TaxID=3378070 RepID=UPI003854D9BD